MFQLAKAVEQQWNVRRTQSMLMQSTKSHANLNCKSCLWCYKWGIKVLRKRKLFRFHCCHTLKRREKRNYCSWMDSKLDSQYLFGRASFDFRVFFDSLPSTFSGCVLPKWASNENVHTEIPRKKVSKLKTFLNIDRKSNEKSVEFEISIRHFGGHEILVRFVNHHHHHRHISIRIRPPHHSHAHRFHFIDSLH